MFDSLSRCDVVVWPEGSRPCVVERGDRSDRTVPDAAVIVGSRGGNVLEQASTDRSLFQVAKYSFGQLLRAVAERGGGTVEPAIDIIVRSLGEHGDEDRPVEAPSGVGRSDAFPRGLSTFDRVGQSSDREQSPDQCSDLGLVERSPVSCSLEGRARAEVVADGQERLTQPCVPPPVVRVEFDGPPIRVDCGPVPIDGTERCRRLGPDTGTVWQQPQCLFEVPDSLRCAPTSPRATSRPQVTVSPA